MSTQRWRLLGRIVGLVWVINMVGLGAVGVAYVRGAFGEIPFFSALTPTPLDTATSTATPLPTASATPTASRTPSPSPTPSPTEVKETSTPTLTATPTLAPTPTPRIIGHSVEGRPLEVFTFGSGSLRRLMVFGIHGGVESNTVALADELIAQLTQHPELIPAENTLLMLRVLNPDGLARGTSPDSRGNAHSVDLNRNWRTANWAEHWALDGCWTGFPLNGGDGPGSEPEVIWLRRFIVAEKPEAIISYHSAALGILPGGITPYSRSVSLAEALAAVSDYPYPPIKTGCEYTGQLADWSALQGIAAVDLELTDHEHTDIEQNLRVLPRCSIGASRPSAEEQPWLPCPIASANGGVTSRPWPATSARAADHRRERRGTQYCAESLARIGFAPRIESFPSARSIYQPHLIASAMMLAAFALYPLGGRVTAAFAAALSALAFVSDLLELSFRDNLLRRIVPKGVSQNAVVEHPPSAEHRTDLVLIGHVDSHRTPIIFSSTAWLSAYRLFTTIAFILFAAQVLLYTLGSFALWNWIWAATLPSALGAVLLAAMCLQADATPFSRGANDNASGAGLVLTLAREFRERPLAHTRVWFVLTGCEEVQHYGAIDFFRRYRDRLLKPQTIAFEMLGCAGPSWLVREGILIPFHADAGMVRLAERVARENPQWKAHATTVSGGNTEMADALRLGIPAITLSGWGPHGEAPYWHMVADTVDKMDHEVMERAFAFTAAYIRALDDQGKA
jgi:hypothetical protein